MPPNKPEPHARERGVLRSGLQLILPLFGGRPVTPSDEITPAPGERWREIRLGDSTLHYLFRRRARRTIGFTIDRRGLLVSAPRWVTLAEVDEAIQGKRRWIQAKLSEWQAFESRLASLQTEWRDGGTLRYLGNDLLIRLGSGARSAQLVQTDQTWVLHLTVDALAEPARIQQAAERWLKLRARDKLGERLAHLAQRLGRGPSHWRLSSARTLWGSCTAHGEIRLNWRLIHLPVDLLDYVVAHELAHLVELNHGPRFWQTVESILPEWQAAKDRLAGMPEHLAL